MEKCKERIRKWAKICFEGELTMPKVNFWLVGAVCLLAGIVYGLLTAPLTHGVTIASHNGNADSYNEYGEEEEEEE